MAVKMEHVLILVIAVFLLYHLMNRCRCNGFNVGSVEGNETYKKADERIEPTDPFCGYSYKDGKLLDYPFVHCHDNELCLCQKGNKLWKALETSPNICRPDSSYSNNWVAQCYDKKDLNSFKALALSVPS